MKRGLFTKLAMNNLKTNYRYYVPYILMGTGLQGCFYIILTLARDKRLAEVRGGAYIMGNMVFGAVVIAFVSLILILYTNSFLMKQRKREFGLYNVLGMNKRHIGKVMFWEFVMSSLASSFPGLLFGMLLYKLCALIIMDLLKVGSVLGIRSIDPSSAAFTVLFFFGCYLLAYAVNRISVSRMKPVELLKSTGTGEKEPKSKTVLFILGILTLGSGYGIAVTVNDSVTALLFFFLAVILVIIGTYCLFTAGSVCILKGLRRNRKYYYDKRHMTTVSGLLFRMKQNAVGLASICILSTCVLVMLSTTMSLYAGMNDSIDRGYPQHVYFSASYDTPEGENVKVDAEILLGMVEDAAARQGLEISDSFVQHYLEVSYALQDGTLYAKTLNVGERIIAVIMTSSEYERCSGRHVELQKNEVAVYPYQLNHPYDREFIAEGGTSYRVKTTLDCFPVAISYENIVTCYGIVVSDGEVLDSFYMNQKENYKAFSEYTDRALVTFTDRDAACLAGNAINEDVYARIREYIHSRSDYDGLDWQMRYDTVWDGIENVFGLYGTLLFLGIILGIVFIFATVLIIYYKQISEGYEDRARFQIMEKIGMSQDEVRKTVKDQLLTVFFLPLAAAGVHIIFAFPILKLILKLLKLSSDRIFAKYTVIVFAAFALVYTVIYTGTSRVYYKIVK